MLTSLALIFLVGLAMGAICQRLKLPRIIGMLITGIVLGPYVLDFLDSSILSISADLRKMALIIILLKAGLSLDLNDLKKVGQDITMGLRQGFGLLFFITGITSIWIIYYFLNLQVVIKKIKANRMYVKEAIYEKTSGKYNRVYLQMYKKGKLRYSGYHLLLHEPLNKGDKVIVLQMRGRAWVYKVKN